MKNNLKSVSSFQMDIWSTIASMWARTQGEKIFVGTQPSSSPLRVGEFRLHPDFRPLADLPYSTLHFLLLFLTGGGHRTALMASSNTVLRPRWVKAEHSRYFTAPVCDIKKSKVSKAAGWRHAGQIKMGSCTEQTTKTSQQNRLWMVNLRNKMKMGHIFTGLMTAGLHSNVMYQIQGHSTAPLLMSRLYCS